MKTRYHLFAIIFIYGLLQMQTLHAQWTEKEALDQRQLNDFDFLPNSNTGIAVGNDSTATLIDPVIMLSSNRGRDWIAVDSSAVFGKIKKLFEVSFPTEDAAYALGNAKKGAPMLLKSTDKGLSWDSVPNVMIGGRQRAYYSVNDKAPFLFVSSKSGFGVIDTIVYKIEDGGKKWTEALTGIGKPLQIFALDSSNIYIAALRMKAWDTYENDLYYSNDGGIHWKNIWTGTVVGIPGNKIGFTVNKVYFKDTATGFVLFEYDLYATKNGGKAWDKIISNRKYRIVDMQFPDKNFGIVSGVLGQCFITSDGGDHWDTCGEIDITLRLVKTHFFDRNAAAGLSGNKALLATSNLCGNAGIHSSSTAAPDFKIYPNPVSHTLHVHTTETIKSGVLSLYNNLGQVVYHKPVTTGLDTEEINVEDFAPGNYIIELQSGSGLSHKQVVVY